MIYLLNKCCNISTYYIYEITDVNHEVNKKYCNYRELILFLQNPIKIANHISIYI